MYKDSLNQEHWYFFAVTGINISQRLLKSLMKGDLDEHLLRKFSEINDIEALLNVMDYFYYIVFKMFNTRWCEAKVGIMEFN